MKFTAAMQNFLLGKKKVMRLQKKNNKVIIQEKKSWDL